MKDINDRNKHPHTDYGIEPLLSALSGSDVTLRGTKIDGTQFEGRLLSNVSFVPRGERVFVLGLDSQSGKVRQFDMSRLEELITADGLILDRNDVLAILDRSITSLRDSSSSEGSSQ